MTSNGDSDPDDDMASWLALQIPKAPDQNIYAHHGLMGGGWRCFSQTSNIIIIKA